MSTNMEVGILILRIVVGLLFAGHGAQKLFGWFGGWGMSGHSGMLEKMGLQPARFWAWISALSEFLGGLGLAFGLLTPFAAVALMGDMLFAIIKVHAPKGVWNTNGGFEYPLTLTAVAFVVGLTGPGVYSLDTALGLALPEPAVYLVALIVMLIVVIGALVAVPVVWRNARRTT